MAQGLWWLAAAVVVYTYIGFPSLVAYLARRRPRPNRRAQITPTVSFIIAAYNEERTIREKLENTLALSYPPESLEIVVAADGSSDGTCDIVREYADRGVQLLHEPTRGGKTSALNRAVEASTGRILFFSDANTRYSPDTVRTMVRNFADPYVGGVSGRKVILQDRERLASAGETAYWGYETTLKSNESLLDSIATGDGEIFAMRRLLFGRMPRQIVHDDMYLTLRIIEQGFRVVYESEAVSAEYASKSLLDEFHLKVRYASAGFQIIAAFRRMLLPPRSWFAFQFLSHKLLRWTAPLWLLTLFVLAGVLGGPFYGTAFAAQTTFYSLALTGWLLHRWTRPTVLYFPLYFSVMNGAALYGLARYLVRGQTTLWRKAER
jgi:cellulose synthase/poly-beta-1,6-N-acetylglucosamine synthase-like glycosyltransferase